MAEGRQADRLADAPWISGGMGNMLLRGQFQSVLTTCFLEVFWAGNYFPAGRIASDTLPGWPFENDTSISSRLTGSFWPLMTLASYGGPRWPEGLCFSHPLTVSGVEAVGLALVLHPEPLASLTFSGLPVPVSIPQWLLSCHSGHSLCQFSWAISCVPEASVSYQLLQARFLNPCHLFWCWLRNVHTHSCFYWVRASVCVCLFKFVFKCFLHMVPFLLPLRLCEKFSSIWQSVSQQCWQNFSLFIMVLKAFVVKRRYD